MEDENDDAAPTDERNGGDATSTPANGGSDDRSTSYWVNEAPRFVRRRRRISRDIGSTDPGNVTGEKPDCFLHRIYDPADLVKAIRELTGERDDLDDYLGEEGLPQDIEAQLSNEETLRLKRLRRLSSDRRGPWRSLIRGTPGMIERLAAVANAAPHFSPFIDLVTRAVHVAIATETPLRLPPILLIGEPGIGKTWTLRQVATAIGSRMQMFAMNVTDSFRLRGLNTAWKGARPGQIAEALLAADTGSPIILLDELEKTPTLDRIDRPFDIWHSLWEPENSTAFVDDYFEIPLRCDQVIWIASANSTDGVPESILDRLLIMRVMPPDTGQVLAIVDGLYRAARERLGERIADVLAPDVRIALAYHTPRRAGRILDLAIGFMAAEGRMALSVSDVVRAGHMTEEGSPSGTFRHPVGFTPFR